MLRIIGSVILGYAVMAALVFATFTLAYFAMGADKAFQPGTYDVTPLWLAVSFVLSLIAAVFGGKVCASVGRKSSAVNGLVGLVLILGLLSAVPAFTTSSSVIVRAGDVPNLEAMMNAKEPAWFALLLPVIGVVGVKIGGKSKSD